MPRFVIAGQPQEEPPFEVSLTEDSDQGFVRIRVNGIAVATLGHNRLTRCHMLANEKEELQAAGLAIDAEGKIEVR